MLKRYTAVHVLKIDCVSILRGKRRLVDQLKYPCRAGQGILQLSHNAGDLIKRLCVLVRIA